MAPDDGRGPADQERVLLKELEDHEPALLERPRLVVGSKADLAGPEWRLSSHERGLLARKGAHLARRAGFRSSRPAPAKVSTGCSAAWPSWWRRPGWLSLVPCGPSCTGRRRPG